MAHFAKVVRALTHGHSIRRDEWEPTIRMFVAGNTLMCQSGHSKPWRCALTWEEIAATDWQLIKTKPPVRRANLALAARPQVEGGSERAFTKSLNGTRESGNPSLFLFRPK
jgi:hypothetical protein